MSISVAKKSILITKKIDNPVEVIKRNSISVLPFLFDAGLRAFSFLWSFIWFYLYIPTSLFFFEMAWRFYGEAPFSPITISSSLILIVIALLLMLHPIDMVFHGIVIAVRFLLRKQ